MKKHFLSIMAVMTAIMMMVTSCDQKKNEEPTDPTTPTENPDKPSVTEVLSPEETKEKLMDVSQRMVGTFKTDDQKAAVDLAEGLYEKYKDYNYDSAEKYANHYDQLFRMPRYVQKVLRGESSPASAEVIAFSFESESVIFEADEQTRTWKNLGKAPDNSIIIRCTDKNGNPCEAKFWGEGQNKTYEYTYEEYHWEAPKVYVNNSEINYVEGIINDDWHYLYLDDDGRWYYTDYNPDTGMSEPFYVELSACVYVYAYSDYHSLYYDQERNAFYYNDWEHEYKVSDGWKTYRGTIPEKMLFTLKQSNNEVIRFEMAQELVKNDHANISLMVKVTNLSWTADIKIASTSGSFAFNFKYGNDRLFGAAASLPSYKLIDKTDEMTYEDWVQEYGDRYEELIKSIGEANGLVDMLGEVQIRIKIANAGYAYRDFKRQDGYNTRSRESVEEFCRLINENQTNGIYYNSDVKQAEVRVQVSGDDYGYFEPEGVLYFPSDSTTYAFEQYFNRKPFTDLQYAVEDLANAYIRLSHYLYDEVGDISFDR